MVLINLVYITGVKILEGNIGNNVKYLVNAQNMAFLSLGGSYVSVIINVKSKPQLKYSDTMR